MRIGYCFLVLLTFFLSSCVTNKKFQLLQNNDVNADKNLLTKDSVLRSYSIDFENYKIQPEDIINIQFSSLTPKELDFINFSMNNQGAMMMNGINPALFGEIVDKNGEVKFPFIGKIRVAGLNIFQIQDELQLVADKYLESPIVRVRLINFRITVLGEVAKEGTVVIQNDQTSMLEALGWAGGLGELADRSNIKLIRSQNGKTTVQYIDLTTEKFMTSPYYFIQPNDVIIVPALRQRPFRRYFSQNFSLFVSTATLVLLIYSIVRR